MEYRGIEYRVVQGVGRHMWTWTTSIVAGVLVMGKAHSKAAAVTVAEKAIERALRIKLSHPRGTIKNDPSRHGSLLHNNLERGRFSSPRSAIKVRVVESVAIDFRSRRAAAEN
jgi:hypothetical protein